jgi:FkbM family methyltransferase
LTATITLGLVDGTRIVVPDSLDMITPYVLAEQQDWFEDEIRFVRRLLQPGQSVIDIGANYGVYTLSMAQVVGPTGRVWAFEPATRTAQLLAESIAANGFRQIELERSAVARTSGTGRLSLNANAEINALVDSRSAADGEQVPLVTLDACLQRHGWRSIDFLKIDAEGAEAEILQGARRFFAECSPLVLYEVREKGRLRLELMDDFAAFGYAPYRLVPGLDLLVPFDAGESTDGFLLNLFCCKPDRAEALAARGLLLRSPAPAPPQGAQLGAWGWRRSLAALPYASGLARAWERTVALGESAQVEEALALYAFSRDATRTPPERFAALEAAFHGLLSLYDQDSSYLRPVSLARVARDYGARSLAGFALKDLSENIAQGLQVDAEEPFLAAGERFDAIPPGEDIANWVLAAALEEFERLGFFSSYYSGDAALPRLETIRSLGFGSAEMDRRLRLVQRQFNLTGKGEGT